ncbi:MAG: AAA family ATPase [bacterium]|nr:AAA family ATPase [bacterium]
MPKPDTRPLPERGEELYALWAEYRRRKLAVLKEFRAQRKQGSPSPSRSPSQGEGENTMAATVLASDPDLQRLGVAISARWRDPALQEVFTAHLTRELAAREEVSDFAGYHRETADLLAELRVQEDTLLADAFAHRGQESSELQQIELADLRATITAREHQVAATERASPDLASRIAYERLRTYRDQLSTDRFIWTPSRDQLFRELRDMAVILNRNRPLVLIGETGTGKTELVRALARRLTGKEPIRTTARDQSNPGRSLGYRAIKGGEDYVAFGTIGQGLTGKKSTRDTTAGDGRIVFEDEANKYPEDFIRTQVKTLAGKRPGDLVSFEEWLGAEERLAPHALLALAMNLPDTERGRHLDRPDFSPEIKRELAPTTIRIEYLPQSPEDPELFEALLAATLSKDGRLRLQEGEVGPTWIEKEIDPATHQKRLEVDTSQFAGGTLWRFSGLIAETQKLYEGKPNILTPTMQDAARLEHAVLEVGTAISWLEEYGKSSRRSGISLQRFLANKLESWAQTKADSGQALFPKEDREVLGRLLEQFRLDTASAADAQPYPTGHADARTSHVFTEQEIGFLSPRVSRPDTKGTLGEAPGVAFLEDGTEIAYAVRSLADAHKHFDPKDTLRRIRALSPPLSEGEREGEWTFLGTTEDGSTAILQPRGKTTVELVPASDVLTQYERWVPPEPPRAERKGEMRYEQWAPEVNRFLKESIRSGKSSEFKTAFPGIEAGPGGPVEFLIQHQQNFYRVQYGDPTFTIDRATLSLPPERLAEIKAAIDRGEVDYPLVVVSPRTLTREEQSDPALGNQPRTLHRVLFDRLIREKGIKIFDRTDPTVDVFLDQIRDLTLADLTRIDLKDTDGSPILFDKDHWLTYLHALYPTLPRQTPPSSPASIGFVKWEQRPPTYRTIAGTTEQIGNKSQLDAVRLRYPLMPLSQYLTLFAQYREHMGGGGHELDQSTWSWLFGIIDPTIASAGPSVFASWGSDGLDLYRDHPGGVGTGGRLRSSR